ncbi:peptidoglycan editing factor PgeF [Brachybacterium sp. ACRRE]|uniref:peptidoglycan editing factor PgeF n=1 Tax=Brachybacterium sp. ACRRE TaxID=2918184 RepID=UPI001EF3CFB0|nr:peptidoglycan editing factor PgeF [Brachybacterium sp. ACRRE]
MNDQRPTAVTGARAPRLRGARALFTTRLGGVSEPPFDGLNLAHHVGDAPEAVTRNRELIAERIGAPLVFVEQVHSDRVHVLRASEAAAGEAAAAGDAADASEAGERQVVTADALVTDRGDVALAIMVADCLPVLLSDAEAGVVAAAHAGRAGLLGGVLERTLEEMRALGARPEHMQAAIGPGICGSCYEVPEEMRARASADLPAVRATTRQGTPALDLRAGARAILEGAGLEPSAVDDDHPCTLETDALFSYRRAQRTGRFAGVIRRD